MNKLVDSLKCREGFCCLTGVTFDEIEKAEAELTLHFSHEYREYLRECGVASADGHEFTGLTNKGRLNVVDVTKYQREKNPQVPICLYVVEELQTDGIVIWQSDEGKIYQTIRCSEPEYVCDSICEYIDA